MGRLWDDHFRDLGHPPKFYRVQDAGFIGGSSIWWKIILIAKKNHWKIITNHVFKQEWHSTKKKPPAGKLATEVRAGDAPKPTFSTTNYEKLKKSGNQPPVTHVVSRLVLPAHPQGIIMTCRVDGFLFVVLHAGTEIGGNVYGWRGVDFRFFLFFIGFHWKWGFWCIPSPDFCGQHPCRGLSFLLLMSLWRKNMKIHNFSMIFLKMTIICH